ncbi:MAG TPA: UDP-N-acetylmuramoyl-tripeptide--D-alanyl-D-alanine ligase [Vicinamibacterales bacterium]|nr:UDP-N-acetylmuramoyl-tripeptide--D-alanyl-D-alanine ligase [Vicinamibacterales bacterium]
MAPRDGRMQLDVRGIAAACGARIVQGDASQVLDGFSIDSRTVVPGDLFIALLGERFDGHDFIRPALERGAAGALISREAAWPAGAAGVALAVDDTLAALQRLATAVRRESGARVVAVTGSAGKTTTKEVTAEFLGARYRVFRNRGNLNNHIGLPLSLLELRHRPDVAVVELGMNHPGEIRTLVNIARPDVRVWTNVGDAHLGFFGTPDAIADAKAEILEAAGEDEVVVANADDARVMARVARFPGRVVTFGFGGDADVKGRDVRDLGVDGMRASIAAPQGARDLATPLLGRGNLANVLAAAAIALQFDVPLDEIVRRAAVLRPASHRGEVVRLANGVTVIDDSYNSSPSALARALEVVAASSGYERKAAVLGEMLELGEHAARLHDGCGRAAARAGVSWLIAVGGQPAAALARAARESGMAGDAVVHVPTSAEAAEAAASRVRPGDLVLVKGSRGIGTEFVVQRLKEAAA